MNQQVEGGQPAYCPRCQQHGHYVTLHTAQPPTPDRSYYR